MVNKSTRDKVKKSLRAQKHQTKVYSVKEINDIRKLIKWYFKNYCPDKKPNKHKPNYNPLAEKINSFCNRNDDWMTNSFICGIYCNTNKSNRKSISKIEAIRGCLNDLILKENPENKQISNNNQDSEAYINEPPSNIEESIAHPIGLKLYKKETPHSKLRSFSSFLQSDYLEYLSRIEFKKTLSDDEKLIFFDENDLLESLYLDDYDGIIIHGQGGIGKTRFMLELGRILFKKNHVVIEIDKRFDDLRYLVNCFNHSKKYILLFDYLEEQKMFEPIVKWINDNDIENVKIIANCRNSFLHELRNLSIDNFRTIDIGLNNSVEKKYKREIVYAIISSIDSSIVSQHLNNNSVLKTFYQARPSYAAFIKYTHQKNPSNYIQIDTDVSFTNWLLKTLSFTLFRKADITHLFENNMHVFQIFSCLSADINSSSKLKNKYLNEINRLISDGWIDDVDNTLSVVHDTVNDTLLTAVFHYFKFDVELLNKLLSFSLSVDGLTSLMWSIQRIWDENIPKQQKYLFQKSIKEFLDRYIDENLVKQNWFKYKIYTTHLLNEIDRIQFFIRHREILKEILSSEQFGNSLSYTMNWLANSEQEDKEKYSNNIKELFFKEWNISDRFGYFVDEPILGGRIISGYINLFGVDKFIENKFNLYIKSVKPDAGNVEYISYALVSWLENNGRISFRLKKIVKLWFKIIEKEKSHKLKSPHLVRYWLAKGDEPNIVVGALKKYFESANIPFEIKTILISLWLKNGDNPSKIKPYLVNCLLQEMAPLLKANCIVRWLEKGDDPLLVKPFIVSVLQQELKQGSISRIISFWLEKGDDPKLVKQYIVPCLQNGIVPQTDSYVISYWLEKGDDPLLVKPFIVQSLQYDISVNSKSYIISHWLEKGDDPLLIRPALVEVFKQNIDLGIRSYLVSFWVEKGNDISVVTRDLKEVIKNITEANLILINNLLISGIAFPIIKKYLKRYFLAFPNSQYIPNIVKNCIVIDRDTFFIEPYIEDCLIQFADNPETIFIISFWIKKSNNKNLVFPFIEKCINLHIRNQNIYLLINTLHKNKIFTYVNIKKYSYLYINNDENYRENKKLYVQVLRHYIEAYDNIDDVKNKIDNILQEELYDNDTEYILSKLLELHSYYNDLKAYCLKWLNHIPNRASNKNILSSWLKGGLNPLVINKFVIKWVEKYYNSTLFDEKQEIVHNYYLQLLSNSNIG